MRGETIDKQLLQLGVTPSKERGQNFLCDQEILEEIAQLILEQGKSFHILEIGPGLGALTEKLEGQALSLTVVEIEKALAEAIRGRFLTVNVVNEDLRSISFNQYGSPLMVVGNLPYCLSTEIILKIVEEYPAVERAVFLLQKEFAERVAAKEGGREYGRLSIAVARYFRSRLGPIVLKGAFFPVPKVNSQVVVLERLVNPIIEVGGESSFQLILKSLFSVRRKKISNGLRRLPNMTSEKAAQILRQADIDPNLRPEAVSLEGFIRLNMAYREISGLSVNKPDAVEF